jgi:hypothetical protein
MLMSQRFGWIKQPDVRYLIAWGRKYPTRGHILNGNRVIAFIIRGRFRMIIHKRRPTGKVRIALYVGIAFAAAIPLIGGILLAPWLQSMMMPDSWQARFQRGLSMLEDNPESARSQIDEALNQAALEHASVKERMNLRRQYAEKLWHTSDWRQAEFEAGKAVALYEGLPAAEKEDRCIANEASDTYEDKARYAHYQSDHGKKSRSHIADQEKAFQLANKFAGPDYYDTLYKAADLASMYAEVGENDKADELLKLCVAGTRAGKPAESSAWYIYAVKAGVEASEHRYNAAAESFAKARLLASPSNQSRVLEELADGLQDDDGQTKAQATKLFNERKFDQLDKLANQLISSRASKWNGHWQIEDFYEGIIEDKVDTSEADYHDKFKKFHEWLQHNSQSVNARVGLADCYVGYAWKARGGGWANTVSDEGFRLFHQRLQQAQEVLDADKSIMMKSPFACTVYQNIALGTSMDKQEYLQMVSNAAKIWPGYHTAILNALWYLQPRWFGDNDHEWEKYLVKQADTIGGAEGNELIAQAA